MALACFALTVAWSDVAAAAKKHPKTPASQQASDSAAAAPPPAVHDWSGFYIGLNAGIAWGQFDPRTSTAVGGSITNPGAVALLNGAGSQTAGPFGFSGGAQAGYNWQSGSWLAGIESDVSYLHLTFASRTYVPFAPFNTNTGVINAYSDANWVATLRPRLGFAAGDWLFYATGGLTATEFEDDFALTTVVAAPGSFYRFAQSGSLKGLHAGYAAGGGIEYALGNNWSAQAEYQHLGFGRFTAKTVSTSDSTQAVTQSADLNADIVRLGLNYRFGGSDPAPASGSFAPQDDAPFFNKYNWEFDFGMRAFFSNGLDAESNPLYGVPPVVLSRLFWGNMNSLAGETYGRIDHASGWFVKGNLGAGGIFNGTLNDEDFPAFSFRSAYSNTATRISGSLGYATVDLGYTFLKAPGAKLGAFIGYNFYSQQEVGHGCTQLGNGDSCVGVDPNYIIITNSDVYNSMRLGLSADFMLTDRLKFTADAAYVPLVNMNGVDDHNARAAYFPETDSDGYGTMLEAYFSYNVTDHWDVGAGGRYWAWTMRHGTSMSIFENSGDQGPASYEPNGYDTRRYGAFVQSGYHWGDTTRTNTDAAAFTRAPMDWNGLYVGGHLGGGWSTAAWADPFGATNSPDGSLNFPGFGDNTKAHGPLGGGQVGANWQFGSWVYGIEGDASYTTMRGDNTCFSGIGGINCEHVVNVLATLAGRIGFAWDRSLFYLKGGGAWTNTSYNLDGDTFGLTLGLESSHIDTLGWVGGIGLEYAFTDHWTTRFEYDHIDLANATPSFPGMPIINTQRMSISQSVDTLELGVNYKFDWPAAFMAGN